MAFAQEHKVGVNKYVIPTYPPIARQARIFSDVVVDLKLNAAGDVVAVDFVSAHPMLKLAVQDAIKQWRFVCLDCRPGEEFLHRFTFSWKLVDVDNCYMTGFRRAVLEFPNRLTVERATPCLETTAYSAKADLH